MTLDPKQTAFIIIDVQVDFCSPEGLSTTRDQGMNQIYEMMPRLKKFREEMQKRGVLTIFTQFITTKHPPENVALAKKEKGLADICVEHTKGAELYDLVPTADEIVLQKERYDSFASTQLKEILDERNVKNVIISGVRTDICVDATAKRAFAEGYNVFIASDLVATKDSRQAQHNAVLETFNKYSGFVETSQEVLANFKT